MLGERWFAATIWNYWLISLYWYPSSQEIGKFCTAWKWQVIFKAIIVSIRGFKALLSLTAELLYINPKWAVLQSSDAEQSVLSLLSRYKIFVTLHPFYLLIWKALAAFQFVQRYQFSLWMSDMQCGHLGLSQKSWMPEAVWANPFVGLCLNVHQTVLKIRLQINSLDLLAPAMAKCA